MEIRTREILQFFLAGAVTVLIPKIISRYEIIGEKQFILRFVCLAAGLWFVMGLETMRAAAAGEELESREFYLSLFKLGIVYCLGMFLISIGGIALII